MCLFNPKKTKIMHAMADTAVDTILVKYSVVIFLLESVGLNKYPYNSNTTHKGNSEIQLLKIKIGGHNKIDNRYIIILKNKNGHPRPANHNWSPKATACVGRGARSNTQTDGLCGQNTFG